MESERNEDDVTATLLRSSVQLPGWMADRLDEIAKRTLSSRAQVIRRLIAEGLDREPAEVA